MGGLQFFCTGVDEPNGDLEMCKKSMEAKRRIESGVRVQRLV